MELWDRIAQGWSRVAEGLSRIEQRLWTGAVVRDYGPISEGRLGIPTRRVSVLLTEKRGTQRLYIRQPWRAPLGLDREAAEKLLEALEDALPQMPEDPRQYWA
jgi:hypothetical protein